jgi:urea transport system substrate-binding protein
VQYEGLEASPNIIYTGLPQSQIMPVTWILGQAKRILPARFRYVFPRTANKIITAQLAA